MTEDVFLGMERAVARVAEELHGVTPAGPSPLRDTEYPDAAAVLWRWVDAPQDAPVWAFVRAYTEVPDRKRVREALTTDDFATLITFARRCALAALRNEDPGAVESAFDALSATDLSRVDWREVATAAALASYAAKRVGVAPDEILDTAVRQASPEVGDLLARSVTSELDLAGDWGYREVRTALGPALLQSGVSSTEDLLTLALGVADLVEKDGTYEVTDVGVAEELPAVWLGNAPAAVEARRDVRGCVQVHAEPVGVRFRDFLLVFVADAADERGAESIAFAARQFGEGTPQLGIAVGHRCAVMVASSAVVGQPSIEDRQSLARFLDPLRELLTR